MVISSGCDPEIPSSILGCGTRYLFDPKGQKTMGNIGKIWLFYDNNNIGGGGVGIIIIVIIWSKMISITKKYEKNDDHERGGSSSRGRGGSDELDNELVLGTIIFNFFLRWFCIWSFYHGKKWLNSHKGIINKKQTIEMSRGWN